MRKIYPVDEDARPSGSIYSGKRRSTRSTCRMVAKALGLVLGLLLIICGVLFLVVRPQWLVYSIDHASISNYKVKKDMSVDTFVELAVIAHNPNRHIGIYYEKGSEVSAWYKKNNLYKGTLPSFYQSHRNTTLITSKGPTQIGSNLLLDAMHEEQQTGSVPVHLHAHVPVRIKVGGWKLRKMKVKVKCLLAVDGLNANMTIAVQSTTCNYKWKF